MASRRPTPEGRVEVEKERDLRTLIRQIANPLGLGEMADATYFVLSASHWKNHFDAQARPRSAAS